MSDDSARGLTLSELPELRRKTEAVSKFLQKQIGTNLETLRPLFAPDRVLGKPAGGRVEVQGSERALTELQQSYKPFARKPYDLPETLDTNWLTLVGSALELHTWDYTHTLKGKTITMSSPIRWVINYRSSYTAGQVKAILAGKESARPEYLRQFVVNTLVLQLMLSRNPGLVQLFKDLRYLLTTETPPDLKGLPVLTITSCLTSFRPADELIEAATAFSGVPAFIELLDLTALQSPKDWFKEELDELTK